MALSTADSTLSAEPISSSIFSTASLAPPCAGPHSAVTPAATEAYGLAPVEPTRRTVEVEAFCSWSACRTNSRSSALTTSLFRSYLPSADSKVCFRKRLT
ncbi:hypothetical protein D3C81_1397790 [compost metagenome]